jgi:hypothetical protein
VKFALGFAFAAGDAALTLALGVPWQVGLAISWLASIGTILMVDALDERERRGKNDVTLLAHGNRLIEPDERSIIRL